MSESLSIVLVTSPIGAHPETDLIDNVIKSFQLVAGLEQCPLVIVCDGVNQIEQGSKTKWKRGRVTERQENNYREYIRRLRDRYERQGSSSRQVTVLELGFRHGFAHSLLQGMRLVQSEYVMAVQHDRAFVSKFSVLPVLDLFNAPQIGTFIKYIGFQSKTNAKTAEQMRTKYGRWCWPYKENGRFYQTETDTTSILYEAQHSEIWLRETDTTSSAEQESWKVQLPATLMPLVFRYDSTHICRTKEYIELIEAECKNGEFIEDSYGHRVLEEMLLEYDPKRNGRYWSPVEHLIKYGTFLYLDREVGPESPMVAHLHGRMFYTSEQRLKNGWPADNNGECQKFSKINFD